MPTLWITALWEDNRDGDVDFAAQELLRVGVAVNIHHWNPRSPESLWDQINKMLSDSAAEGWAVYTTRAGLGDEERRGQVSDAFGRLAVARGDDFPTIALFPSVIDRRLIARGVEPSLSVSLTDPEWKERIAAALSAEAKEILPYSVSIHRVAGEREFRFAIEVRPRVGTWSPFLAGILISESTRVIPGLHFGASGSVPDASVINWSRRGPSQDGLWWLMVARNEATPAQSYFVTCQELPTELYFGAESGDRSYQIRIDELPPP